MSQEVVQWLREIQDLKQQLAAVQQALATADASADSWRRLYETEAQQRRSEANSARQTIAALQAELATLKDLPLPTTAAPIAPAAIAQAIAQLTTPDQLQAKLREIWLERDQLAQTLKVEQANHIQTRQNLTLALGDTMEILQAHRRQQATEEPVAEPEP
jgi:hypothetical protein